MTEVIAYVGLGSNLHEPVQQLRNALTALTGMAGTRVLRHSRLYRSSPWGVVDQPEFVNAVAEIETTLAARGVLTGLLAIERSLGRERDGSRWGPRVIDLDLLLYGTQHIREPGLEVPHPRMAERAFVLVPLAELNPQLDVPGCGLVANLLANIDARACTPLSSIDG